MEKYIVTLHSLEQIHDFIHAVEKIPYNMDIVIGTISIDAKSFQGIVAMGLNKRLPLTIYGELTAEMKDKLIPFIEADIDNILESVPVLN